MDRVDRIDTIGASILAQAKQESRRLIDEANSIREQELSRHEERIVTAMGAEMQKRTAAIRYAAFSAVATERTSVKNALLRRRDELTTLLFVSVRGRLADYAKTEEYRQAMLREIAALTDRYDHRQGTLFLGTDDLEQKSAIEALLPGCRVEPDETIRLGGWKYYNEEAAIQIDHSLETRLADQKAWFLEHCHLEVV